MPVFECEFNGPEPNVPSRIECITADTDGKIKNMRLFLMSETIQNYYYVDYDQGNPSPDVFGDSPEKLVAQAGDLKETLEVLQTADPTDLPIKETLDVIGSELRNDTTYGGITITDKATGVCIYSDSHDKIQTSGLEIDSSNLEELQNITDDPEFITQAIKHGCNFYGYTPGPRDDQNSDIPGRDFYEHYTLGHMDKDGKFTPVVVVLDETHPLRQRETGK